MIVEAFRGCIFYEHNFDENISILDTTINKLGQAKQ
jgi:hypothetical protein